MDAGSIPAGSTRIPAANEKLATTLPGFASFFIGDEGRRAESRLIRRAQVFSPSIIPRTLQIAAVRIAHIALAALRRRPAVLVFVRRRRSRERHLRVFLKSELVGEDAARQARRILRKSDGNGSKQGSRGRGSSTNIEYEFHGRSARRARIQNEKPVSVRKYHKKHRRLQHRLIASRYSADRYPAQPSSSATTLPHSAGL